MERNYDPDRDPHRDPEEHPEAMKVFAFAAGMGVLAILIVVLWEAGKNLCGGG